MNRFQRMDYLSWADGTTGTIVSIDRDGWARMWLSWSKGQPVLVSPFDLGRATLVARNYRRVAK